MHFMHVCFRIYFTTCIAVLVGVFKASNNIYPSGMTRTPSFPDGLDVDSQETCCTVCYNDNQCQGTIYLPDNSYCFPLVSWQSLTMVAAADIQQVFFTRKGTPLNNEFV